MAAGRLAWTVAAGGTGTAAGPVTSLSVVLVAALLALFVADDLAAVPARSANRIRPAAALRAE